MLARAKKRAKKKDVDGKKRNSPRNAKRSARYYSTFTVEEASRLNKHVHSTGKAKPKQSPQTMAMESATPLYHSPKNLRGRRWAANPHYFSPLTEEKMNSPKLSSACKGDQYKGGDENMPFNVFPPACPSHNRALELTSTMIRHS